AVGEVGEHGPHPDQTAIALRIHQLFPQHWSRTVAKCAGHRLYAQWQRAQYDLCRSRERPCRGRALDRQQRRRRLSQAADRGGGGEELERSSRPLPRNLCRRPRARRAEAPFFVAMRMSAIGTKRTYTDGCRLSAFGAKADIRNGTMRFAYCALREPCPSHRVGWMPSALAMVAIWARWRSIEAANSFAPPRDGVCAVALSLSSMALSLDTATT